MPGVRAGVIHECFSAHQGVEDDDMNVICLGGHVVGNAVAWELVRTFLQARCSGGKRHCGASLKSQVWKPGRRNHEQ